jgi:hypothetical protein
MHDVADKLDTVKLWCFTLMSKYSLRGSRIQQERIDLQTRTSLVIPVYAPYTPKTK